MIFLKILLCFLGGVILISITVMISCIAYLLAADVVREVRERRRRKR